MHVADPSHLLAIAFGPPTMAAAVAGFPRIRAEAECAELRLDLFQEPFDLPVLLRERGDLPVVVTLRPPDQGGKSPLPPEERLEVLLHAAALGAEYVDLEWKAATPQAISALHAAGARVVVSRHDFAAMPPELVDDWWPALAALGADVVKVVGTASDVRDCLPILRVLSRERANVPTVAIAMGEAGLPTRVLALRAEQCFLTYAAASADSATAPGQLTAREMRETYRVERLRPGTRVFGLLGPHAEGPRLDEYNAWFARDDFDAVSVPFKATADASGIVSAFRELPVAGWHIHGSELQASVLDALDDLAPAATRHNKVNGVVRRKDGRLVGYWVESPREQYDVWRTED
ncbi:MAG: type I 3-dehydroquinate dehydratase [Chloroflexota bacterium]|nr:type I 3-dehydroquinate dehydratase [Chloroflexota bacterium]